MSTILLDGLLTEIVINREVIQSLVIVTSFMLLVKTVMAVFEYHLEISPIAEPTAVHRTEVPTHALMR